MLSVLVLEAICLNSTSVQLFFLLRTSSSFLQIISREKFWRKKFAKDGLLHIPLQRKECVQAWLIEYNARRNAKLLIKRFRSGDGAKDLTLDQITSLGIQGIQPRYSDYVCELSFHRRPKRNLYVYNVSVVRKIKRQPGRFYSDVKQSHLYRREVSKEEFYNLLFMYYYKLRETDTERTLLSS